MPVFADVTEVSSLLVEPEVDPVELDVPPEWEAADTAFTTIRDTTNKIIGALGHVGVHIEELPGGDLADILITPFSGDYNRIRANGVACDNTAKAMRAVAKNVAAATADMTTHWSGDAATAFTQQTAGYVAVTTAASYVMEAGKLIYDFVATRVQGLAELAIKIIVKLAKILVRLMKNIASRFAGWLAWVKLATDLARHGLDPIRDIYDDIVSSVEIVLALLDLKDAIETYVESIRKQFSHFLELPALVKDLPSIVDSPLSTVLRTSEQAKAWEKKQTELEKKSDKAENELAGSLDDAGDALDDSSSTADAAGGDQAE